MGKAFLSNEINQLLFMVAFVPKTINSFVLNRIVVISIETIRQKLQLGANKTSFVFVIVVGGEKKLTRRPRIWLMAALSLSVHSATTLARISFM